MRDRRRFHRWDCSLSCRCVGEGFELNGTLTNLSFNGARVYTGKKPPPEGSEIKVSIIEGNGDETLEGKILKARVVSLYNNGECFGIEFYGQWDERVEILMPVFQRYVKVD